MPYYLTRDADYRAVGEECLQYIAEHQADGDARIIQTMALAVTWASMYMSSLSHKEGRYIDQFRRRLSSIRSLRSRGIADVHTLALVLWTRHPKRKGCKPLRVHLDRDWERFHRATGHPADRLPDSLNVCALWGTTLILERCCDYIRPEDADATVDRYAAAWRDRYTSRPNDVSAVHFAFHWVMSNTFWGSDYNARTNLEPERAYVRLWSERRDADIVALLGAHAAVELFVLAVHLNVPHRHWKASIHSVTKEWRNMRRSDTNLGLHMAVNLLFALQRTTTRKTKLLKINNA